MRPASAVQRIRTDPHSPTKFRVQGTLSNIPEFAKAFNCSVGSKVGGFTRFLRFANLMQLA